MNNEVSMKQKLVSFLIGLWVFLPTLCIASPGAHSLGEIAGGISDPILGIIKLVHAICLIAGVGLVVGSVIRYKQHRQNPVEVPMSSCIMLLIAGLALIALTFIPLGFKK